MILVCLGLLTISLVVIKMTWFKRHRHKWDIIGYAYSKDYNHPNCFDELGQAKIVMGTCRTPWGQDVTVFTLRCQECGDISYEEVDGLQEIYVDGVIKLTKEQENADETTGL